MKNVFKVVSVVMVLALLVGVMAATGLLASADEPVAIATWSDSQGLPYTWLDEAKGKAFANVYSGTAGKPSAWGEFAATIAEVTDNQFVEVVVTGTFTGATAETTWLGSRVWNESTEIFATSATENKVVFQIQGPLTSKLQDPNLNVTFMQDMTAISAQESTHVTVTLYEGKPVDPEAEATATEADSTETGAEPTATEPVVTEPSETEPSETEPSETEPVVTEPSETKPSTPVVLLYGDANGDNEINMKDVLTLRKYLAGMEVEINMTLADANGDDEINMKDVLALRKYLAGMDQVLGK